MSACPVTGLLAVSLVVVLSSGCARVAFNLSFPDNRPDVLAGVAARIQPRQGAPRNATGKPLVFVVTSQPARIVAFDVSTRRVVWSVEATVTSRLAVGHSMIFHRAGDREIVGRKVADGSVAWRAPLGRPDERLLGMTADGDKLYYATEVIKRAGGGDAGRLVAVDGTRGGTRWYRPSTGRVGTPAARNGLVFVPLRAQSIAVLDDSDGREIARARSQEETLTWVHAGQQAVLFGGASGIYRLDHRAASGTRKGSTFLSAGLPESVRPVYWWHGYNAALAGYTAYDRNRLLWRVDAKDGLRFHKGMIFVHNYRFLFAFGRDAQAGMRLRWAYSYPRHDVIASAYTGDALLLITAHGRLVILDPDKGLPVAEEDLKVGAVDGATFDVDGLVAPGEAVGEADLRKTLKEVIWDPDRRFGAVKLFAVEQLGQLEGKEVASDLVQIVTRAGVSPAVYERAGEIIVSRHDKDAVGLYLETLGSRYSFVDGTQAKAVDVMANALGDLKVPEAVQPLLRHLADHETRLAALPALVEALVAIGDKSVVEPFRDLLLTYRCDPLFDEKRAQNVLSLIAEALLKMGGPDERQLLSFVANDVHSLQSLRTYIEKMLRKAGAAGAVKPKPSAAGRPQPNSKTFAGRKGFRE